MFTKKNQLKKKCLSNTVYLYKKPLDMKSNPNAILIDNYFGLLNSLSKENKLKLIAKLSNSIIDEGSENENIVDKFFGAFKSEKSAEELIKEIRESRTFNRTIEPF
jgi:predicted metal-binding transcription factor (methanogenesis marker protein 9)